MNPNPYVPRDIDWSLIDKWEQLDFVKALPDDIKSRLRRMPDRAEVQYDQQPQGLLTLDPEKSRLFWLKRYNTAYQPIREKNAKLAVIQAQTEFFCSMERSLAHISSILERMNQHLLRNALASEEVLSICQQLNEDRLPF